MAAAFNRAVLGFLIAGLSVLTFHQGMWELLHLAGDMPPAYPTFPTTPFGVPLWLDLTFWGAVWGAAFAAVLPLLPRWPLWLLGLCLGIVAALFGIFIVPLLKGHAVAPNLRLMVFELSFLINGAWGVGVGLFAWGLSRAGYLERRTAVPAAYSIRR